MSMADHSYLSRRDLHDNVTRHVLPLLQAELSDCLDLFAQMKQAHWTVRGPQFHALHKLFDELAEELEDASDDLAERISALGGVPDGRSQTTARTTRLYEYPEKALGGQAHLRALAGSIGQHAAALRAAIDQAQAAGDAGSADLLTGLSRQADKQLWLIEAHLMADA
jgi:starvation-inducible DNA-binding protein